jgi:hypothetical protein
MPVRLRAPEPEEGRELMGLPWFRVDSNIAMHDKVLGLLSDPSAAKWQAFSSYICALGWSAGTGNDGRVPRNALGFVHGTTKTARLLEKYRLWTEAPGGWQIVNYAERQQLSLIADMKSEARHRSSVKANCVRHHGDSCWVGGKCSRSEVS